jgi:hypothetical protein
MNVFRNVDNFTSLSMALSGMNITTGMHVLGILLVCKELSVMRQAVMCSMQATMQSIMRSDNRAVQTINNQSKWVQAYNLLRKVQTIGDAIVNIETIRRHEPCFTLRLLTAIDLPIRRDMYQNKVLVVTPMIPGALDPMDLRRSIRNAPNWRRWDHTMKLFTLLHSSMDRMHRFKFDGRNVNDFIQCGLYELTRRGVFSLEENRQAAIGIINEIRLQLASGPNQNFENALPVFADRHSDFLLHLLEKSYKVADITPSTRGLPISDEPFHTIIGIQMTFDPDDVASYLAPNTGDGA